MATPPITMGIQSPNIAQQLLSGISQGQNIAANRQAMNQNAQQSAMQNDEYNYQIGVRRLQVIGRLAQQARQIPQDQRAQFVQSIDPGMLKSVGIDPAQAASVPLDDAGLDNYIAQVNSVLPQDQMQQRVQSSQILDDGTTIQILSSGERIVTDPAGNRITGQAAVDAIRQANDYSTRLQGERSGSRAMAGLEARSAIEPELRGDIVRSEQQSRLETEPEIQAAVARARTEATAEAEKKIGQQGQLGKLEDATAIYNRLRDSDLDVIYGRGEKWYPEFLRSQRGIDLIADRDQLVNMLKLGAAGELKGQGTITDAERKMLADAATQLGTENISPAKARQALDDAMKVLMRNAGNPQGNPSAVATPGINPNTQSSGGWSIRPLGN